jgi:Chalcone isomerase-like
MRKGFCGTVLVLAAAIHAMGASLAGVTLPDSTDVGGKTLVLNGIGLRTKLMFKVYVAGLYLEHKSSDPDGILKQDAPRRVVMQFLRDLSRDQMVEAFTESFENNSANAAALKADIDKMLGAFEPVKTGEQMVFTYQPGVGTTLAIGGKDKVTVAGQAFGRAMFACWLGPKPPSSDLKARMLGK